MSLLYVSAQILRHEDNPAKHATWLKVMKNMQSGLVTVGSRAPIASVPVWATPEVAHGGFATGSLRAGGKLAAYEQAVAGDAGRLPGFQTLPDAPDTSAVRALANRYLVESEAGNETLLELLHSRKYRVNVPEEGCLLAYAWLCENNFVSEAHELLGKVAPYFEQMRFHPEPRDEPEDMSRVSIQSVHDAKTQIRVKAARQYKMQALSEQPSNIVWHRLREEVLELWLETLDEPSQPPNGSWHYDPSGAQRFEFTEGCSWPCQQYPAGWNERAADLVARYGRELERIGLREKHHSRYSRMVGAAATVARDGPQSLTGNDVGWIRFGLAAANVKRGLPGSAMYQQWLSAIAERRERRVQAIKLCQKLYAFAIECLDAIARTDPARDEVKPYLVASEVQILRYQLSTAFPLHHKRVESVCSTLEKTVGMDLSEMFACQSVKSLEVVAQMLPKFTASIRTNAVVDQDLAYLYQQILVAFAQRRSLLLLYYASQVRVTELPWVAAIDRVVYASDDPELTLRVQQSTMAFCREVTINALKRFGETPLCNPFIGELRPMLQAAGVQGCDLVKEIAADIFMGSFTVNYGRAFAAAYEFLKGTKYQAYYQIKPAAPSADSSSFLAGELADLCYSRAQVSDRGCMSVSGNAKVIEQCQILTTHNLAALFVAFDLHEHLDALDVPAILQRCWAEIKRLAALLDRASADDWDARGPLRRFIGYTWRQMVFYFAVLEKYAPEKYSEAIESMAVEAESVAEGSYRAHFAALAGVLRREDPVELDHMDDADKRATPAAAAATQIGQESDAPPYVVAWGASRV